MSELTKEFERIIEDTSGGTHNSQDWWDMDLCGTETIIEGLCKRLESAALSSIPELPPVAPENLVEGEWYYCVKRDWQGFGKAANDSWCNKPTGTMAIWIGDVDWSPSAFAIYGPLRFKIGGAE